MSTLVSIVVPAFNAAKTLKVTIQSVFQQTVQDLEIIIVDDGSSDDTLITANTISALDTRVRIISQANSGASAARNTGIKAAKGKYVAFLDADDTWLPHKLERQLTVLNSERGGNAGWCGVYYVNDDLDVLSIRPCFGSEDIFLDVLLFRDQSQWMSTLIIERSVLNEIGPFDEKLGMIEDWEFMLRLVRHCELKNIEEPLTLYRVYPGNRSRDWKKHVEPGYQILDRQFADPTLSDHIKKQRSLTYSAFYTMLSGGAFVSRDYIASLRWGAKAVFTHPRTLIYIVSMPLRRLRRTLSRRSVSPL